MKGYDIKIVVLTYENALLDILLEKGRANEPMDLDKKDLKVAKEKAKNKMKDLGYEWS